VIEHTSSIMALPLRMTRRFITMPMTGPLFLSGLTLVVALIAWVSRMNSAQMELQVRTEVQCEGNSGEGVSEEVASVNRLARILFAELEKSSGTTDNIFFSPASLIGALSLAKLGTTVGSAVEQELSSVIPCAHTTLKFFADGLIPESEQTDVRIANSLWARVPIKPGYSALMHSLSVYVSLLSDNSEPVNRWAADVTKGKIFQIVDSVEESTVALLVNAVYFKAAWTSSFSKSKTQKGTFKNGDNTSSGCMMMSKEKKMLYSEFEDGSRAIRITYGVKREFESIFTLPASDTTGSSVITNLINSKFEPRLIRLYLPRFKVSYSQRLRPVFEKIGLSRMFTEENSFDELSTENTRVSDIIHKSVLEVDEDGTTAAAVTSMTLGTTSVDISQPLPFVVDRPFYVSIRHKSGLILFTGKVNKPEVGVNESE